MSSVHKFKGDTNKFGWEGVDGQDLKIKGIASAVKHVLIGDADNAPNMIMRFFELSPGGHSRLETHPQEHEVIVIQGKGKIQIEENYYDVEPYDAVFIEGGTLHQFSNPYDEPFGFICVIPKNV